MQKAVPRGNCLVESWSSRLLGKSLLFDFEIGFLSEGVIAFLLFIYLIEVVYTIAFYS